MPQFRIHPHTPVARFTLEGFHTWCATAARAPNGKYHLYASAWPEETGHDGWVTNSRIVHAVSDHPLGPYEFCSVVLGPQTENLWDRDVAHNPTVIQADGKWVLYYVGNKGNGEFWNHRNNQRIGVAVADNPEGPFVRAAKPLFAPGRAGDWDDLMTTNPTCTQVAGGGFVMIYKAVSSGGNPPAYGPVRHGVAFSSSPTGPFVKHPEPVFECPGIFFAAEDPFLWSQNGNLFCILKDMGHNFSTQERALVLFSSTNGIDWKLESPPVVTTRRIVNTDGSCTEYDRLERPQLLLENGVPTVLHLAAKPERDSDESYSIHLAVEFGGDQK